MTSGSAADKARLQAAGSTVKITFQHDGQEQTADLTLDAAS
ncbi:MULTISPECIES: hypothetical protein [unclassified Arthrobacter]